MSNWERPGSPGPQSPHRREREDDHRDEQQGVDRHAVAVLVVLEGRRLRPAPIAVLRCCTRPELPVQEFENHPPSRESHSFESQTSCLLRNRSGGLKHPGRHLFEFMPLSCNGGAMGIRTPDLLHAMRTPRVARCRRMWSCQQFLWPDVARHGLQSPIACSPSCSPGQAIFSCSSPKSAISFKVPIRSVSARASSIHTRAWGIREQRAHYLPGVVIAGNAPGV
jgi:hypothetical protein